MIWRIKPFDELTSKEMHEILKVRAEVFVVEQNCVYLDADAKDELSHHLFLDDGGVIGAYLRILPRGVSFPEPSIGRVLTKPSYRGQGHSKVMIQKAIDFIANTWHETAIRISAQAYLLKFYNSFGFEQQSGIYLEDNIEHIEMLLRL